MSRRPIGIRGDVGVSQQQQTQVGGTGGGFGAGVSKVGSFLGIEKLGRRIGSELVRFTPEGRELRRGVKRGEVTPEQAREVTTGGVTGREALGSAALLGLNLALPGAGKFLTTSSKIAGKGIVPAIGRRLTGRVARSAGLGAGFGAAATVEEGKLDSKSFIQNIAVSSMFGAAIPFVGIGIRATGRLVKKLPEKFFAQIFKRANDDVEKFFKTKTLQQLQKESPAMYDDFVKKGIIKAGATGKVQIDKTLAREALEAGFKGSSEKMTTYAFGKMFEFENQLLNIAKQKGSTINLGNKQKAYISLLTLVKNEFRGGQSVFGERSSNAAGFIKDLQKVKGKKIGADLGLRLRRFFDDMRTASSFRQGTNLAAKQEEFKGAANILRGELKTVPGFGEIMNEYRIFIQAKDAIIRDAVRRENRNLLNLTDILIGGGGVATGFPGSGIGAAAAVRGFQQPQFLTTFGAGIEGAVQRGQQLGERGIIEGARTVGRQARFNIPQ